MEKNARTVLTQHTSLRRKLFIKLSAVWLVLIVIASIAIGMFFQYGLQNISLIQSILEQKAESQNINRESLKLNKIRSEKLGYELTYNPQIFKTDRATDTNINDLSEIGLTTHDTIQTGFGVILFNAYPETELEEIKNDKSVSGSDDLEKAANWYQRKRLRDLTDTSTFVSKERIQRWGGDAYRFDYKRKYFNKDVFHYVYLTIKNNKLYTVLADYPKVGISADLIESWVDEIAFIGPNTAEVQAETTEKKLDLNEVKLVELNKPSVVQIISVNCITVKVKDLARVQVLKSRYEMCTGGSGSGFMIGKDGLVATNGHVAKASFEDIIYSGRPEPGSGDFFTDFQKEIVAQLNEQSGSEASGSASQTDRSVVTKTPSVLDAIMQVYADAEKNGIFEKAEATDKYFVKLGNEPVRFNKVTANNRNTFSYKNLQPIDRAPSILDAELVASDFGGITALTLAASQAAAGQASQPRKKSSDVAIIKLKGEGISDYPGVPVMSSSDVKEGEQILVMGFPGLVSGQDPKAGFLLDETVSSVRPTITRGIISAVKQDTFGQILLQTDASIEHGNSGGPAFNYFGDVLGIATYVITSGSGNYNFLRSTDDLFNLWESNNGNIEEQSVAYTSWKQGLSYFWEGRFTKAKEQFSQLKTVYPIHPQVDEYIANADKGIESGQDADLNPSQNPSQLKSFGYTQQQITLFIAVIMAVIIVVGGIITTYFIYDHNRKNMNVVIAVQAPTNQTPPQISK